MSLTSASIVTITQYSRFNSLKHLFELILLQDYPMIEEWIIVEGSQTEEYMKKNSNQIHEFILTVQPLTNIKILYVCLDTPIPLSNLRNLGNESTTGDIIVCMDDDDYYPPSRVSHAVNVLNRTTHNIAGCSAMYMYDYCFKKLYKFRGYHNNHSTNNCMAFTREYLKTHSHKEGLSMSEEYSFTNGFTEPMCQLDPKKCIVASSHDKNTFSKQQLIESEIAKNKNNFLYEVTQIHIMDIIPELVFLRMCELFI